MHSNLNQDVAHTIWNSIDTIQNHLGLSDSIIADHFHLSKLDYTRSKIKKRPLLMPNLVLFSEEMNISIAALINQDICLHTLNNYYKGETEILPLKYQVGAYSKIRTVNIILDYIEGQLGSRYKNKILQRHQLTSRTIQDDESDVSITLLNDILDCYYYIHKRDDKIVESGKNSFLKLRHSTIGSLLEKQRNIQDLYSTFFLDLMPMFEKNYHYQIVYLNDSLLIFNGTPDKDLSELIGQNNIGSAKLCLYKTGLLETLPFQIDLRPSTVTEVSCIHRGDKQCTFHVHFSNKKLDIYKARNDNLKTYH